MRMNADMQDAVPGDLEVELAAEIFRMLADATRVRLLWAIRDTELSVGDLAEAVGKRPAAVSQHLAKLRLTRLVQTRREGTTILYRLDNDHVRQLVTDAIYHAQHQGPGVSAHHAAEAVALPNRRQA